MHILLFIVNNDNSVVHTRIFKNKKTYDINDLIKMGSNIALMRVHSAEITPKCQLPVQSEIELPLPDGFYEMVADTFILRIMQAPTGV